MTDRISSDGNFSEREMRLIFERAGQLEAAPQSERRYTFAELQEMGSQAGFDPTDIARAAATVRVTPMTQRWQGAPVRFQGTAVVPRQLSETGLSDVVAAIRRTTGIHGEVRTVPGGVEWHARLPLGSYHVDFLPRRGKTHINLLIARDDESVVVRIVSLVAGLGVGGVTAAIVAPQHPPIAGVIGAAILAGVPTAWATARIWWGLASRRWRRATDALLESIRSSAEATEGESDRTEADIQDVSEQK